MRVDLDGIVRARRGVSGGRRPLRPDRGRRRQQGRLDGAADRRRARPRRPQGGAGPARALRLRDAARRDAARTRSTASRWRPTTRRSSCATASGCARSPRTASPEPPRSGGAVATRRRARAAGSISTASACRSSRGASGGRCCARCGACSATSSGCRTCRASTGTRSTTATSRCSTRVATRGELSDLIWEMQGELGTSHAYEMGGDHRRPPPSRSGISPPNCSSPPTAQSYEITRIVARRSVGAGRRFAAQRRRRRGEGRRAHRRRQRAAGVARAAAAGAARAPGGAKVELTLAGSATAARAPCS